MFRWSDSIPGAKPQESLDGATVNFNLCESYDRFGHNRCKTAVAEIASLCILRAVKKGADFELCFRSWRRKCCLLQTQTGDRIATLFARTLTAPIS